MEITRRKFLKAGALFVPSTALAQHVIWNTRSNRGGVTYGPLTTSWQSRALANGASAGNLTAALLTAMNTFETAIAGISSRIYNCNLVVPTNDFFGFRTPFINTYGSDPWVRTSFGTPVAESLTVAGWYGGTDRNNGYCYDTGVVPSAISALNSGNCGCSVYIATGVTTNTITNGIMGGGDGVSYWIILPDVAGSNVREDFAFATAHFISLASDHDGGFFMSSRTSVTSQIAYRAFSTRAWGQEGSTNSNINAVGAPTSHMYAGGDLYSPSTIHGVAAIRQSFFAWHDGFSSADGQTLYNAVQAFRVSIGGGYL